MLAVIRPDSWNFPLLLHVGGAMILVGALVAAAAYMLVAWNRSGPGDQLAMNRIAFKTLLIVGIPAFLLMRIAAEWIRDKEGFGNDDDPAWIGIGYITSDLGGLLLLISTILAWIGVRQLRKGKDRSVLVRISGVLILLLVLIYVVTIWAMGAKPD
jgi:hypothetical protein